MKTHLVTVAAIISFGNVFAAEPSSLQFGGERIGVPPLSLKESIAQGRTTKPLPFGTKLPQFAKSAESMPLTPNLIPRTAPSLDQLAASRSAQAPRVSRASGMPILEPSDAVDYKLRIVTPNPDVDFKLIIKDPGPARGNDAAK